MVYPNIPAPEGSPAALNYARFIPREELGEVQPWQPDHFGQPRAKHPADRPEPQGPTEQDWLDRVQAASQEGYEQGYRDGLAALEDFKKSHSAQVSASVGELVRNFDDQWARLEHSMAQSLTRSVVLLARQVLRSELATRPELVGEVVSEALRTTLMNARHVVVRVHPEDLPLVARACRPMPRWRAGAAGSNPTRASSTRRSRGAGRVRRSAWAQPCPGTTKTLRRTQPRRRQTGPKVTCHDGRG
jgi:flagellar assembly protein FliH